MEHRQRLAAARSALARAEESAGLRALTPTTPQLDGWQMPEPLIPILPALTPGVIAVRGATSLILAMAGAASKEGAWIAVLGMPWIGWDAAARHGLNLHRTVAISHPGPVPGETLAALADGFDVILAGPLGLGPRDERRIEARLRRRSATLLTEFWRTAPRTITARSEPVGCAEGHLTHTRLIVKMPGGKIEFRCDVDGLIASPRLRAVPS